MAVQMYILQVNNGESDHDREVVAEFIAHLGGFILMATSAGSLIVAFDDSYVERVKAHHLVGFVGGVSLNPDGPLAEHLQRLFAENVAAQLAERAAQPASPSGRTTGGEPGLKGDFPPGYRPLRWPRS